MPRLRLAFTAAGLCGLAYAGCLACRWLYLHPWAFTSAAWCLFALFTAAALACVNVAVNGLRDQVDRLERIVRRQQEESSNSACEGVATDEALRHLGKYRNHNAACIGALTNDVTRLRAELKQQAGRHYPINRISDN